MMKLYFACHGESEANIENVIANREDEDDYPLTGRGREQAQMLAASLADAHLTRLYTSPLLRALETSRIVAEAQRLTPRLVEALRDIGSDESFEDAQTRFIPLIDLMIERYAETDNAFLLIGHGGLFRALLPVILSNVDRAYAVAHPLAYTATVAAEWRDGQLICTDWCGQPVPAS
jgi:broad specificity phosphatase PhoE